MKRQIKRLIKFCVPRKIRTADWLFCRSLDCTCSGRLERIRKVLAYAWTHRFVYSRGRATEQMSAAFQFDEIVRKFRFSNAVCEPYFYPLDPFTLRLLSDGVLDVVSLTLDYDKVLKTDLTELRGRLESNGDDFSRSVVVTIDAMDALRCRAMKYYTKRSGARVRQIGEYLERIMDSRPRSFDEALQKILFFNGLLWYNRHRHIGLGRLDIILQPYFDADLASGVLDREQAKGLVRDFLTVLGSHTLYKSGGLVGDTGQVILISGTARDGEYVENEMTHIFLELIEELNIPDPKLIMRVCDRTTPELWSRAIRCVSRGNGSPLLANESRIMALMEQFGYDSVDVVDFGTSACWEPLIIGKSFDQNNSTENFNFPKIIAELLDKFEFTFYQEFEEQALKAVGMEMERIARQSQRLTFDRSPIHSIWMEGCVEALTDVADGGAKYNFHGFLTTGLPNAVNAMLNVKRFVFQDRVLTYRELQEILRSDFAGREDIRQQLLGQGKKFGLVDEEVLELSNKLMRTVSEVVERYTINGQRAKVGFSSPDYLSRGALTPATADGRHAGDPFTTHISPVSHEVDFAQIIDFASLLDYSGNKINGNVVDFILSNHYVSDVEKLGRILGVAFKKGVFEMQLNVLDLEQLKAAKVHPELYPHLVVRVWGFSAYFNDLPESYKDMLIERAEKYAAA